LLVAVAFLCKLRITTQFKKFFLTMFEEGFDTSEEYFQKRKFETEEEYYEEIKRRRSTDLEGDLESLKSMFKDPLTLDELIEKAWGQRGEDVSIAITKSGKLIIDEWIPILPAGYKIIMRASGDQNLVMELCQCSGMDNLLISSEFLKRFGELIGENESMHVRLLLSEVDEDYPRLTDDCLCTVRDLLVEYHRGELRVHLVIHGMSRLRGDGSAEEQDTWSTIITVSNVAATVKELKNLVEDARDAGSLVFKNCAVFDEDFDQYEKIPLIVLPKVLDFVEFHPDTPTTDSGVTEWDKPLKDFGNANSFVWQAPRDGSEILLNFHCYVVDGSLTPLM
jgi:hypothetical protein